jgi:N-acetylmuramoyl-L-alanine amidase
MKIAPCGGADMKLFKLIICTLLAGGLTIGLARPAFAMPLERRVIVVDAGHGGWDPGMVSGRVDEKDINLQIAQKLQTFLELGGATVIITRLDDSDLSKSKSGDMAVRRRIANTSRADIFVSIHQNAFGQSSVHGAQVFYFNESDNSKKLATAIQDRIKAFALPYNRFTARANSNYFVLKQTEMPAVLVECGFLTNPGEKAKLLTEGYQEKIAWAIYLGIVDYFYAPCHAEPEKTEAER